MAETYRRRNVGGFAPPPRAPAAGVPVSGPPARGGGRAAAVSRGQAADQEAIWTPAFVGLLFYVFAITTFRLPIGSYAMALAILTLPMESHSLRFPPVAILAVALAGWAVMGLGFTAFPEAVVDKIWDFSKVCVVVLVAINVITTRRRLRVFLFVFLACFCAYPVRGTLIGYFIGHNTVEGRAVWNQTYENPNDLAGICLIVLSLSLGISAVEKNRLLRYAVWIPTLLLPLIILLTQSRGAFIGLGAIGLIAARQHWRDPRKLAFMIGIGVLVVVAAPNSVWKRLGTLENAVSADDEASADNDEALGSTEQRLEIWKVARTIAEENFVTGVGLGAYNSAHRIYALRPEFSRTARGGRDTHSTYLSLLAELGIVGLVLFMTIVFITLVNSYRARNRAPPALAGEAMQLFYMEVGLYGYLIAGIWGTYGGLVSTYLHFALMFIATRLLIEDTERLAPGSPGRGSRQVRGAVRGRALGATG